jgi:hypothetical protein
VIAAYLGVLFVTYELMPVIELAIQRGQREAGREWGCAPSRAAHY